MFSFAFSQRPPRSWLTLMLSAFLAVADGGCGTWIGNAEEPTEGTGSGTSQKAVISLSILGATKAALLASTIDVIGAEGTSLGHLELTDAKVALGEIKFKAEDGDVGEAEFKGPYIVDLLNNKMQPDPGSVEVAAGGYKDIILKLHKVEKDGESTGVDSSDPIIENSVYLKGSFVAAGGAVKPFELAYELGEEFSLAPPAGSKVVDLAAGITHAMIIAFRLDSWFRFDNKETNEKGFDFSDITTDGIVLNKNVEDETIKKIRETIKDNIKESADFGKDADEDGKLETEESQKGEDN